MTVKTKKRIVAVNENIAAIRKELDAISSMGYNQYKVFTDWIALMFYAYMHDDPNYLKIMKEYRNDAPVGNREADHFANAHACLFAHMQKTNEEVLSNLYMEYCANSRIGQFFTPYNLAEATCNLMLADIPKDRDFTVYDPTCGAGVFFIAAAKSMSFDENCKAIFIGHDLDINCVHMSALNLMFFNLKGIVIHGNTLNMEVKDAWEIKRSLLMGGSLHHIDDLEKVKSWYCNSFMPEINNVEIADKENIKINKKVITDQRGLFE